MVRNILVTPLLLFYHLGFEYFNKGQSIGKKLMGIRVVGINGSPPSLEDYLLRWAFRTVDIIGSLGTVALISSSTTNYGQRLGDILAQTTVISTKSQSNVSIKSLSDLREARPLTYKYNHLDQFNDQEMLLIKQAINRLDKYPNEYNMKNVTDIAHWVKHRLKYSEEITNAKKFLTSVLKEYIQITR